MISVNRILIVSHSTLAEGFYKSEKLLVGNSMGLKYINAYVDETDWTPQAEAFFENYDESDTYIILTDIFGGSVNQKMAALKQKFNFILITGINLPLLLALVLAPSQLSKDECERLIDEARQEIRLVEPAQESNIDEQDFLD